MRRYGIVFGVILCGAGLLWLPALRSKARQNASAFDSNASPSAAPLDASHRLPVARVRPVAGFLSAKQDRDPPAFGSLFDTTQTLPARIRAADELSEQAISTPLVERLCDYLLSPLAGDEYAAIRERALRNHLLNRLREWPVYAEVLVPALAVQLEDPQQDSALRDYAAQHLAAWIPDLQGATKVAAEDALRQAVRNPVSTLPGTSLLGLHDLNARGLLNAPFDSMAEARRIALDSSLAPASRITALSLCSELGGASADLVGLATKWAKDASQPLGAQLAAQALLRATQPNL